MLLYLGLAFFVLYFGGRILFLVLDERDRRRALAEMSPLRESVQDAKVLDFRLARLRLRG